MSNVVDALGPCLDALEALDSAVCSELPEQLPVALFAELAAPAVLGRIANLYTLALLGAAMRDAGESPAGPEAEGKRREEIKELVAKVVDSATTEGAPERSWPAQALLD